MVLVVIIMPKPLSPRLLSSDRKREPGNTSHLPPALMQGILETARDMQPASSDGVSKIEEALKLWPDPCNNASILSASRTSSSSYGV
jgi:hypothetical protein